MNIEKTIVTDKLEYNDLLELLKKYLPSETYSNIEDVSPYFGKDGYLKGLYVNQSRYDLDEDITNKWVVREDSNYITYCKIHEYFIFKDHVEFLGEWFMQAKNQYPETHISYNGKGGNRIGIISLGNPIYNEIAYVEVTDIDLINELEFKSLEYHKN